jgi:hypothetical protein
MRYTLLLVIAIGCGKATSSSSRACDDLAITSAAATQFLDLATGTRQSKPDISITLCQATNTAIWQMGELLRLEKREELTKISYRLEQINCAAGYHDDREASAIAWKSRKATAIDAINTAVSDCYSASGEAPKDVPAPPPIVLPTE